MSEAMVSALKDLVANLEADLKIKEELIQIQEKVYEESRSYIAKLERMLHIR